MKSLKILKKKNRRKKKLHKYKLSFLKFKQDARKVKADSFYLNYPLYKFIQRNKLKKKPNYTETLNYFIETNAVFGKENERFYNGVFEVPQVFSIIENYSETTLFLRKFFNSLYHQNFKEIFIDYINCKVIDVCAFRRGWPFRPITLLPFSP